MKVGPDHLDRQKRPERNPTPGPAPRQEKQEKRGEEVREDVGPLHDPRGGEDHHEGESRDGHGGGRAERAGGAVEGGGT